MIRTAYLFLVAALFAFPSVPQPLHLATPPSPETQVLSGVNLPVLPAVGGAGGSSKGKSTGQLRPESELAIVRFVDGEFARAVRPLPSVKKGFHLRVGAPLDETALRHALAQNVPAANPGDTVQITNMEFRSTQIFVDINGGSQKRKHWRDRIQVQMSGGSPFPRASQTTVARGLQAIGATLVLDFGGPVPDLSPEQVKQALAPFLDFSKERSAAVNWVETLPPQYKQAIGERRAIVGMDRDMVLAAMGPPDHKVRERDANGVETEDWIYGTPPEKTTFVTFIGDKVVKVKQFN